MAPEILKKLEKYESGKSQELEKIEELSQAIAQLTTESQLTREWFTSQLQLFWEKVKNRDDQLGTAMQILLDHTKSVGERLEILMKIDRAATLPETTPTLPTFPDFPDDEPSNKHPAEEELVNESSNKRRKIGRLSRTDSNRLKNI